MSHLERGLVITPHLHTTPRWPPADPSGSDGGVVTSSWTSQGSCGSEQEGLPGMTLKAEMGRGQRAGEATAQPPVGH